MQPLLAVGIGLPLGAKLGIVFVVLGFAATFLMYHLWGYPFDEGQRLSAAPRWAMWLHRGIGYAFAIMYIYMMWRMVPRLWTYQVELPARTVAHLLLGFTVGFLLIVKISIMRFFRHFEEWMPYLGTAILLCTVLLLGLSLPAWVREQQMAHGAPGGDPFGAASRERVARLLPEAELPEDVDLVALASEKSLRHGRDVLVERCVSCHDLKTILDRPRTPKGWWDVVERMGEKPALFSPLQENELLDATAYLIAITPDLQKSVKKRREEQLARESAANDLDDDGGVAEGPPDAGVPTPTDGGAAPIVDAGVPATADGGLSTPTPPKPKPKPKPAIDPAKARATFERVCSQCHETSDVDGNPPRTRSEVRSVVKRMVEENGLEASRRELELVRWWLEQHYVQKSR